MNKLTPFEVIDLIVETYVNHPENRSMDYRDQSCLYKGEGNKVCAFAFFCTPGITLQETKRASHQLEVLGVKVLKEEVRHIEDPTFWDDVQKIHDGSLVTSAPDFAYNSFKARCPDLPEGMRHVVTLINPITQEYYPWISTFVELLKDKWKDYDDRIRAELRVPSV